MPHFEPFEARFACRDAGRGGGPLDASGLDRFKGAGAA